MLKKEGIISDYLYWPMSILALLASYNKPLAAGFTSLINYFYSNNQRFISYALMNLILIIAQTYTLIPYQVIIITNLAGLIPIFQHLLFRPDKQQKSNSKESNTLTHVINFIKSATNAIKHLFSEFYKVYLSKFHFKDLFDSKTLKDYYVYGPKAIIKSFSRINSCYKTLDETPKIKSLIYAGMSIYLILQLSITLFELYVTSSLIGPLILAIQNKNHYDYMAYSVKILATYVTVWFLKYFNAQFKRFLQSKWVYEIRLKFIDWVCDVKIPRYLYTESVTVNGNTILSGVIVEDYIDQCLDFTIVATSKIVMMLSETLIYFCALLIYSPYAAALLLPYSVWASLIFFTIKPNQVHSQKNNQHNMELRKEWNEQVGCAINTMLLNKINSTKLKLKRKTKDVFESYTKKNFWKRISAAISSSIKETLMPITYIYCGYLYINNFIVDFKDFWTVQSTLENVISGINEFFGNTKMYVDFNYKGKFYEELKEMLTADNNLIKSTHRQAVVKSDSRRTPYNSPNASPSSSPSSQSNDQPAEDLPQLTLSHPQNEDHKFKIKSTFWIKGAILKSSHFKNKFAIDLTSGLALYPGDTVLLRGTSGGGKTSLIRLIAGLVMDKEDEADKDKDSLAQSTRTLSAHLSSSTTEERQISLSEHVLGVSCPDDHSVNNDNSNQKHNTFQTYILQQSEDLKEIFIKHKDRVDGWANTFNVPLNDTYTIGTLSTGTKKRLEIMRILCYALLDAEAWKNSEKPPKYKVLIFDEAVATFDKSYGHLFRSIFNDLMTAYKNAPSMQPTYIEVHHCEKTDGYENTFYNCVIDMIYNKNDPVRTIKKYGPIVGNSKSRNQIDNLAQADQYFITRPTSPVTRNRSRSNSFHSEEAFPTEESTHLTTFLSIRPTH